MPNDTVPAVLAVIERELAAAGRGDLGQAGGLAHRDRGAHLPSELSHTAVGAAQPEQICCILNGRGISERTKCFFLQRLRIARSNDVSRVTAGCDEGREGVTRALV